MNVTMTINGRKVSADVEERTLLAYFIREQGHLTGTHVGCDSSSCGCCVVLQDGSPVKSCTAFAVMAEGSDIRTVEGLAQGGTPAPAGSRRSRTSTACSAGTARPACS